MSNHMIRAAAIIGVLLGSGQASAQTWAQTPEQTSGQTSGQTLSGPGLVAALRQGGYVIVMRHASSPAMPPDKAHANPDNVRLERQLDAAGREGATAMGAALRELKIPIGAVLTSPTYRARETVTYAGLPNPQPVDQLGDGGQSMQAVGDAAGAWLRARVSQPPAAGTNTILVTHLPNITRAFPDWQPAPGDGESVVLRPAANGQAQVVARVRIEEWARLR
jgi:phosphohistidine phosphatase SixA